jgi:hypothetical protein
LINRDNGGNLNHSTWIRFCSSRYIYIFPQVTGHLNATFSFSVYNNIV